LSRFAHHPAQELKQDRHRDQQNEKEGIKVHRGAALKSYKSHNVKTFTF
jgi:hypothetical protein